MIRLAYEILVRMQITKVIIKTCMLSIVCAGAMLKESSCLLRHIMTGKSGLCQYAVCFTQNTMLKM